MDSIVAAIIVLFLILFAVLTLSGAFVQAQEALAITWESSGLAMTDRVNTRLTLTSVRFASSTNLAFFTYRNDGANRLTDFERWDVIAEYYDGATPALYRTRWLGYRPNAPDPNEWSVMGLYLDAAQDKPEVFDIDTLNPGEEIRLGVKLDPALGEGDTLQITLATEAGTTASGLLTRNIPPVLATNAGLSVSRLASVDITDAALDITDADDLPEALVYTVLTPPAHGTLNLGGTFTQADIDAGLLTYTHDDAGDADDSFEFQVSDGDDGIGPFVFTIAVSNVAPLLATNNGLTLAAGSNATLGASLLRATDADHPAAELTYTIANAPAQGTLSLGSSFTQADIDAGLLSYTHTGTGNDAFSFTVSDGIDTIGLYWFNVTVP